MKKSKIVVAGLVALTSATWMANATHAHGTAKSKTALDSHLVTFDNLDFDVFTHQKWNRLHESHSKDILVHWPDGHQTKGIERHIKDLKALFVYAPDTRIVAHPIRLVASTASGSRVISAANTRLKIEKTAMNPGDWTCVTGILKGTFTKPMTMPNGKVVQPTGKAFTLTMCTLGRWRNGVMVEEWIFWDNQTYMKQIGIA